MSSFSAILHNPYVWGSLGLSAGSLLAYIKDIPGSISAFFRRTFTCSFQVSNMEDKEGYRIVRDWISSLDYSKKTRNITAVWSESSCRWKIAPAPGNHLIWIMGRPVWLIRERKDVKADAGYSAKYEETIKIRILGRNKEVISKTLETIESFNKSARYPEGLFKIYMTGKYSDWDSYGYRQGRDIESVVLPNQEKQKILADLDWFLSNEKWYLDSGIPYRRGWLLKGSPGTGKSSLIVAIATHYRLPVYYLSLSEGGVSDNALIQMFASIQKNSIILLEDIDAAFDKRKNENKDPANRLTFAGLLNAIDGVSSPEGSILFMTTNHPDRLDPALIRPGRIDQQMEFGPATYDQLIDFYARIRDEEGSKDFAEKHVGKTIAEAQICLMEELYV